MDFNIYVDAESMFDFRLAALVNFSPELKFRVAELYTEYTRRDHDEMHLLFHEVPSNLDVNPSIELMRYAPITDVDELIRQSILAYVNRPDVKIEKVTLTVDFQGLPLSVEQLDKFKLLISSRFDHAIQVKLINQKHINLRKLDTRYQLAIVYNTNERIVKQMTKPKHRLKQCNIQTPFLFLSGTAEQGRKFLEAAKLLPYRASPEEVLKEQLLAIMPLHFVEMQHFCAKQL